MIISPGGDFQFGEDNSSSKGKGQEERVIPTKEQKKSFGGGVQW